MLLVVGFGTIFGFDWAWRFLFLWFFGFWFIAVYVLQDQPHEETGEEYTAVIGRIEGIEKQLSELSSFLKRERQKLQDSEVIISRLQNEKSKLEPIVLTQRETVEAILSAHTKRISATAWKERIAGFGLGVLASLIASVSYEYLKH
jgi:hypothetical protein